MTKLRIAVVIAVIAVGIWFLGKGNSGRQNSGAPPNSLSEKQPGGSTKNVSGRPGMPTTSSPAPAGESTPTDLAARAASPTPATPPGEIPLPPPATILDNARIAIHNYHERFGENPVGTNPEITAALMGKNPKQVNFITPESGLRVNGNGEMIDGYGTPFFFHQLSAKEMEIHSAGQDKLMWTYDDVVTR